MCISAFNPSSSPSYSFAMLLIHSAFLLCSLGCIILLKNCSASLASVCWYAFVSSPPTCWYSFLSLFLNVLFCQYCFTLSRDLFNDHQYFLICFLKFNCFVFLFYLCYFFLFSQHVPAFFLCFIIFACFHRFLICFSSRISHQDFEFLLVLFTGSPIFSQTNFAVA